MRKSLVFKNYILKKTLELNFFQKVSTKIDFLFRKRFDIFKLLSSLYYREKNELVRIRNMNLTVKRAYGLLIYRGVCRKEELCD